MSNALYINRILVYPKLGICDVNFRHGLNVIVSEDVLDTSQDINSENEEDLIKDLRNSTGKTTFINLIDYALGKDSFINNEYKENQDLFEDTYVVAEISIHGVNYTIKRSIIDNDSIIIYYNWISQSIISNKNNQRIHKHTDLNGYISFLEWEIFKGENYFKDTRIVSYRSIMNFIIRDQFFGFSNYYSGLKIEKAETSRERLKFLFGLITSDNLLLKEEISKLESEKKLLSNEYNVLKKYLLQILKNTPTLIKKKIKENEKSISDLRIEFNKFNKEVMESERVKDEDKNNKYRLEEQLKIILNNMTAIKSRIFNYNNTLNEIDNELNKLNYISISIGILNPFKYSKCPIFMQHISNENDFNNKCPFIEEKDEEKKDNEILEARRRLLEYEKKDLKRALLYLNEQLEASINSYDSLRKHIEETNLKIEGKKNIILLKRDNLRDQIKKLQYENETLEHQISQYSYLDFLKSSKKDKHEKIKLKKSNFKESSGSINRINEIYNEVVEFLSGKARGGTIDSKTLEPSVVFKDGKIDTGAGIKSVGIIAFDLTMLTFSLENKAQDRYLSYMDFLVHDSPKRSDIDVDMYKRVFDYIIKLEEIYLPLNIDFQYIITTLDISNKVINNKDKYVRLTLNNSGNGGKLFGTTINI